MKRWLAVLTFSFGMQGRAQQDLFRQLGPDVSCSLEDPSVMETFPDSCYNFPPLSLTSGGSGVSPGTVFYSAQIACGSPSEPGMTLFTEPDCFGTTKFDPNYLCVSNELNGTTVSWTWVCLSRK